MSKIVKVQNGNLKFVVSNDATPASATITLDTGARTGTTVVTGDLIVQGTTTTVESNNTTITDNIILLNQGESQNYVTLQYSGIQCQERELTPSGETSPLCHCKLGA